jgi:hypothetical protein
METNNNLIVFFDTIGRLLIGEKVKEETTDTILVVKNPAVVHIQPNAQTGQLSLQILPIFFKEFLADKAESTKWKYHRALITESEDVAFDFKLQAQYAQLFSAPPVQPPPAQQNTSKQTEVIKLFDE